MINKEIDLPHFNIKDRTGEVYPTFKSGNITILEYINSKNCTVKFEDGCIRKKVIFDSIKKGNVSRNKDRVGEKYTTNEGYIVEVIEYLSSLNCTIRIDDWNNTTLYNVRYHHVVDGNIKNPYHRSVFGVGYFGIINYGKMPKVYYKSWNKMMERCYAEKLMINNPTYKDCVVDERWHNFQVFVEWMKSNYNPETMQGWHLDKDILVKGNKVYSPETCAFVPREINGIFAKNNVRRGKFLIGVSKPKNSFISHVHIEGGLKYLGSFKTEIEAFEAYKTAKELYIKRIASKYKNVIKETLYQSLMTYKVEIDD